MQRDDDQVIKDYDRFCRIPGVGAGEAGIQYSDVLGPLRLEAYQRTLSEIACFDDEEIANILGIEMTQVSLEHRFQVEAKITAARIHNLEAELYPLHAVESEK